MFPIGNTAVECWQTETVDQDQANPDHGCVTARKPWTKTTVKERVDFVIDVMGVGVREWARNADYNPGQISKMRSEDEARSAMPETFWRLAKAAEVSYAWLSLGVGEPKDVNALSDLDVAIRYHGAELTPGAVAWAKEQERAGNAHPPKKWAALMFVEQSKPKPLPVAEMAAEKAKRDTRKARREIAEAKKKAKSKEEREGT